MIVQTSSLPGYAWLMWSTFSAHPASLIEVGRPASQLTALLPPTLASCHSLVAEMQTWATWLCHALSIERVRYGMLQCRASTHVLNQTYHFALQDLTSHISSTYNDESLAWYHVWPYNCATLYTLKIRTWDAIMTPTIDSNEERCYQDLSSTGARILPIVARLVNHLEIFGRRVFFCILIPAILWYYVTHESQVFTCLFHGTFHMRPKPISN